MQAPSRSGAVTSRQPPTTNPGTQPGDAPSGSSPVCQSGGSASSPALPAGQSTSMFRTPQTPTPCRSFGAVLSTPATPGPSWANSRANDDTGPRLEDLYFREINTLPNVCEVTDPDLQNELLKDVYKDLPNLK
jgi:hypothetical protein